MICLAWRHFVPMDGHILKNYTNANYKKVSSSLTCFLVLGLNNISFKVSGVATMLSLSVEKIQIFGVIIQVYFHLQGLFTLLFFFQLKQKASVVVKLMSHKSWALCLQRTKTDAVMGQFGQNGRKSVSERNGYSLTKFCNEECISFRNKDYLQDSIFQLLYNVCLFSL